MYLPKKRILLDGPPKCGKTTCLSTLPKGSSLYHLDADRQAGGLVKEWEKRHGTLKDLKLVPVPFVRDDTKEIKDEVFREIRRLLWNPPSGYDFYAIDSYTRIVLNLAHVFVGKGERNYNEFNNAKYSAAANDLWFQFVERIEYLMPGSWTITIMHERWEELDDGTSEDVKRKPQMIVPACGTSAQTAIPANHDFVWHTEKGRRLVAGKNRPVSLFRTRGTPTIMASSVGFDDVLEETEIADFGAILKKLNLPKEEKKEKEVKQPKKEKSKWQK